MRRIAGFVAPSWFLHQTLSDRRNFFFRIFRKYEQIQFRMQCTNNSKHKKARNLFLLLLLLLNELSSK